MMGCGPSSSEVPVIKSNQEYSEILSDARELSEKHIVAFREGIEPDDKAVKDLRRARQLFQSLLEYSPTIPAPVFGAAEVDYVLGDHDSAIRNYRQSINLEPLNADPDEKSLVAEAYAQISRIYLLRNAYEQAEIEAAAAVEIRPKDPHYLVDLASAKFQRGEVSGAAKLCLEAVRIDPENSRAVLLLKLIQESK